MIDKLRAYLKKPLSLVFFGLLLAGVIVFQLVDQVLMPWYVAKDKITTIPDVTGKKLAAAQELLIAAGLKPIEAETRQDPKYPPGTVSQQNPPAGSIVKQGRGVYLTVSGGEALVVVPTLTERSLRDGTFALERYRLKLGEVTYEISQDFPENVIASQSIPPGAKVLPGTRVAVTVSLGPTSDRVPVPNLVHKPLEEAQRLISQAGLQVGVITYQSSTSLLPNTIIDHFPKAGELVVKGRTIDLFVAQKAETISPLEN